MTSHLEKKYVPILTFLYKPFPVGDRLCFWFELISSHSQLCCFIFCELLNKKYSGKNL